MNELRMELLNTYKDTIYQPFCDMVEDHDMIQEGDVIAVCISGDNHSLIMMECMELYKKVSGIAFDIEYILMTPTGERVEDMIRLAKKWDLYSYHILIDKSQKALEDYIRQIRCNKIMLNTTYEMMLHECMSHLANEKEIKEVHPVKERSKKGLFVLSPLLKVKERAILCLVKKSDIITYPYSIDFGNYEIEQQMEQQAKQYQYHIRVYEGA